MAPSEENAVRTSVDEKDATRSATVHDNHLDEKTEVVDNEKAAVENDTAGEQEDPDAQYPSGIPLALLTLGLCLTTFVVSSLLLMTPLCQANH